MTLIEHIERYLGLISQGWRDKELDVNFSIVAFNECPVVNTTTFLSLGISKYILPINQNKKIRQELVFSAYKSISPSLIVSFLMSIGEVILHRKRGVLRGEVISLSRDLAEEIGFDAVYFTIPFLFDDNFDVFEQSSPPTIIVLVIPIYQSEVSYIELHGWSKFEDLMENSDIDLYALERVSII